MERYSSYPRPRVEFTFAPAGWMGGVGGGGCHRLSLAARGDHCLAHVPDPGAGGACFDPRVVSTHHHGYALCLRYVVQCGEFGSYPFIRLHLRHFVCGM